MKIKNNFLYAVWIFCMLIALSGCNVNEENEGGNTADNAADNFRNTERIIVTYQTMDYTDLTDMDEITAAINEITVPEIGVEVEFRFVDARDAFTEYSLWISNGKHIDLMVMNNQNIMPYINKQMILPLDDYLQKYAPDIVNIMEKEGYHLTEGSVVDGKAYGVTVVPDMVGSGGGIWIPERYLEEAGMAYSEDHIYSLEEIWDLCASLKKKYPEKYPLGQITSKNVSTTMGYYQDSVDTLGGDSSIGYLDNETGRIKNYFETEEYYEFLYFLRQCYLKGYIYPDAAITDADISELTKSGIILSWAFSSVPGLVTDQDFGERTVCLHTSKISWGAQYSKAGFWTIPSTSRSPEASMKFLNLLYRDNRISNLLDWGIEGKHYVVTDEENGLIAYPDGEDQTTVGYYNPLSLYGDFRKNYSMQDAETRKEKEKYAEKAMNNQTGVRGFIYSAVEVAGEIDAVQDVVEKYVPVLESGSVELDVYYPEFLRELQNAGMAEILADRQRQYDEWSENK